MKVTKILNCLIGLALIVQGVCFAEVFGKKPLQFDGLVQIILICAYLQGGASILVDFAKRRTQLFGAFMHLFLMFASLILIIYLSWPIYLVVYAGVFLLIYAGSLRISGMNYFEPSENVLKK